MDKVEETAHMICHELARICIRRGLSKADMSHVLYRALVLHERACAAEELQEMLQQRGH